MKQNDSWKKGLLELQLPLRAVNTLGNFSNFLSLKFPVAEGAHASETDEGRFNNWKM